MAGVEGLVSVWKEWGIQVLVLLSFAVQVILLITGEIRRLKDSGLLRAIVWLAYQMADTTAVYALGHMSVTSRSAEHQLMAFWAPFLLLHLGGQDNITAYAIEDNQLWLRHLQTLGVQASAAAFVLYQFFMVGTPDSMLWCAAILMIVVGFLKYGERVWALKCASASNLPNKNYMSGKKRVRDDLVVRSDLEDTENLLWTAHSLLNIPKKFFERPLGKTGQDTINWPRPGAREKLFSLVEMQLALMHDVLYSKAEVMHTWYGLVIRIISSASTAVAFVLFHWSGRRRHGYSRADVATTYVLLVGAIVLETISLLRSIFSSWAALADMRPVRRMVLCQGRSWWSESMGQHNLFAVYVAIKTSRRSRFARWMGYEDWWNTRTYSRHIPVSKPMKVHLGDQFFKLYVDNNIYTFHDKMKEFIYQRAMNLSVEMELDECILVWHIATNVYLSWYKQLAAAQEKAKEELVKTIEALSNYMLFILVKRPSMLPNFASRSHYAAICYDLAESNFDPTHENFVTELQEYGESTHDGSQIETLWRGSRLGRWLIGNKSATIDAPARDRLRRIEELTTGPDDNLLDINEEPAVLENSVVASETIGELVRVRLAELRTASPLGLEVTDSYDEADVLNKIAVASAEIGSLANPGIIGAGVLDQIFVASATVNRLATDGLSAIDKLSTRRAYYLILKDAADLLNKIIAASATIDELKDFNCIFVGAGVLEMIALV